MKFHVSCFDTCNMLKQHNYTQINTNKYLLLPVRTSGGSFGRLATIAYTWRLEYPGIYELCIDTKKKHPEAPFETIYCTEHLPLDDNIVSNNSKGKKPIR